MNIGVVGTNFVSDFFMNAGSHVKGFHVTAVTSGHRENADKFAQKYNIENVYDSLDEMIKNGKVEAIYLAVPNKLHKPMALQCLQAHIPCFVEKPFGCSYDEVKEIIDCADANQTYVHDAIIPLYTENFRRLKEACSRIGKIRKAVFVFEKYSSRYDAYLRGENPTTFRKDLCNGSIMDLGVYPISDAVALFGKPQKIFANGSFLESGVDGAGTAVLMYDDFDVTIHHGKVCNTNMISEIQGEKGLLTFDMTSRIEKITYTDYASKSTQVISEDNKEAFTYQIEDFIQSIETNKKESEKVPHQLSLDIHEVLTECRKQMGLIFDIDK